MSVLRVTAAVEVMMVEGCLDVADATAGAAAVTGVGWNVLVPIRGRDDVGGWAAAAVLSTAVAVDL